MSIKDLLENTGKSSLIYEVSQKAIDMNYDGLMIETHINPEKALSDNNQKARINKLDPHINDVLEFWKSERSYLIVNTSGSTGNPKPIKLKREHIINSANATLDFFELSMGSSFLCCMPSKYIGGIMMLIRALVNEGLIFLEKPSRYPIQQLNEKIDL